MIIDISFIKLFSDNCAIWRNKNLGEMFCWMEKLSRAPQLALGVTLTSHCPHLNLPILILTRIIPRLVRANHFPHTIEFNFGFFFKIAFIFRLSKNRTAFHNLPFLSYFLHVLGPKSMFVIFYRAQLFSRVYWV